MSGFYTAEWGERWVSGSRRLTEQKRGHGVRATSHLKPC